MGILYDKKHNYNLDVFFNGDDISYYLLGVFITDGCIKSNNYQISLTSNDYDWIEPIRNIICPTMIIRKYNNAHSFSINSKILKQWFISKGCVPNKSLTVKFPNIPLNYMPDFIRGCIDGDGSLGIWGKKDTIKVNLCGSSFDFLQSYHKVLNDQGIKNYIYKANQSKTAIINGKTITRNSDHWRVDTFEKHAQKLISWIYYPSHKLSMPRKKLIADTILNHKFNPIGRKPNTEKQTKAIELRANGLSLRDIATALATSQSRVHHWISKHNQ